MNFLLNKYLVSHEDLLASVSWRFAHGLLVVESSDSADPHEGWSPAAESVHAGADSLYIAVLPAASGFATLTCVSGSYEPQGLREVFASDHPDEPSELVLVVSEAG
jgi:hypothetical protein